MSTVERGRPLLVALAVLVIGFIVGVVLVAMDFVLIGILIAAGAIPAAFVAWITAGDRY
ncbi:MAG TPA: hypothetical protein VFL61_10155 [Gaiellaceae bacterium]|nr:hypothetical protein [Gaiellaceae bacterium]